MPNNIKTLLVFIIGHFVINNSYAIRDRGEITGWCIHGYEKNIGGGQTKIVTTPNGLYSYTTNGHCPAPPHNQTPGSGGTTPAPQKVFNVTLEVIPVEPSHQPDDPKCRIIVNPPGSL